MRRMQHVLAVIGGRRARDARRVRPGAAAAGRGAPAQGRPAVAPGRGGPAGPASFFITSVGKGDGANYGGLAGADAYCAQMAQGGGLRHAAGTHLARVSEPAGRRAASRP